MINAQFPATADRIEAGEAVIVCDAFMDWVEQHRPNLAVRTIPNPDRVGILDRWLAYTKGNCPRPDLEQKAHDAI